MAVLVHLLLFDLVSIVLLLLHLHVSSLLHLLLHVVVLLLRRHLLSHLWGDLVHVLTFTLLLGVLAIHLVWILLHLCRIHLVLDLLFLARLLHLRWVLMISVHCPKSQALY